MPLLGLVGGPILAAWATRAARANAARATPGLREALARLDGQVARTGPGGWVLIAVAAAVAVGLQAARPLDPLGSTLVRRRFPVDAVAWVRTHDLRGRLFNVYDWGGFLVHALPEHAVAIDGRMMPFRAFLPDYLRVAQARPGWSEALDRHDVRWVLVERGSRLSAVLAAHPAWRLAYEDDVACVLARR